MVLWAGNKIYLKNPANGLVFNTAVVGNLQVVYSMSFPIDGKFNNTPSVAKSQWSGYVGG